jgi:hypothetical protein
MINPLFVLSEIKKAPRSFEFLFNKHGLQEAQMIVKQNRFFGQRNTMLDGHFLERESTLSQQGSSRGSSLLFILMRHVLLC